MLKKLNWDKPLKVNGNEYENSKEAYENLKNYSGPIQIHLNYSKAHKTTKNDGQTEGKFIRIYVKQYMTRKSTPTFDFMKKWNNNNPMPMRLMEGQIIGETKGMYKMKLRGVYVENVSTCSHCGRKLTNEVSRMYGMGPICGKHFHIAPPETVEEFRRNQKEIKKAIQDVTWEGWVIKSAITNKKQIQQTA